MPTRKQNISNIADCCKVVPLGPAKVTVTYRGNGAVYLISGSRPKFLPNRVMVTSGMTKVATNQFVIDGMRLAAQREIDKRKKPETLKAFGDAIQDAFERTALYGNAFIGFDPAKPGSDFTSLFIQQFGRSTRPVDPISAAVARMATMTYAELADEYQTAHGEFVKHQRPTETLTIMFYQDTGKAKREQARKLMDLADDIACARFGVGFYTPGQ